MSHILEDLKLFLDSAPTAWHAVQQIGNRLALHDFTPLSEEEKWELECGKKYFVVRGGSLCAFCVPEVAPKGAVILASHTDSPSLKLKPHPGIHKENMTLFGVEVYGSPLLTSWMNRDLGLAGRVVVLDAHGETEEMLVFIDDSPMIIPQLAIHLDREVNDKGLVLNKQEHLRPLVSLEQNEKEDGYLETLLRRHLSFQTLLSFDLFLVPLEPSRFLGSHGEMLAAPRLDNLASAHACVTALAQAQKPQPQTLQMAVFWDHEEVGSRSASGSASPFLADTLKRLCTALHMSEEDLLMLKQHALCVSVDMAHALHPNYADKHDPNHRPLLGEGIVIKHNADQKYASSASTTAPIVRLCHDLKLRHQSYVTRSDLACGSTVGPIMAQGLGISVVDIGCPQLSMHAAREVMACHDHLDMCHLLSHVLQENPQ
jgi:aspartyl aminopeptidase